MTDHETLARALAKGRWRRIARAASKAIAASGDTTALASDVAYFEPRLQDRLGHFAVLAESHDALCRRLGLTQTVFHHRDWVGARPARWRNVFPAPDHLVGTTVSADRALLRAFTRYSAATVQKCLAATGARVGVFPTARFLTLPGIAAALGRSKNVRGAILGVMETVPVPDCQDEAVIADAFRNTAEQLGNWGGALLLIAESERIAEWLIRVGFHAEQIIIAPYTAAVRFDEKAGDSPKSESVQLGAFGATRPVHNPSLLLDYLEQAPMHRREWTIKLNLDVVDPSGGRSSESRQRSLGAQGIQFLPLNLERADYDAALRSLDVMVLPYGARYQTIGSGIFLECLCAGVIPLVPEHSTMRQLYTSLGGTAPPIASLTSQSIDEAVEATLENLDALRANTTDVRRAWLEHPHGPRTWERRVEAFLQTHAAP